MNKIKFKYIFGIIKLWNTEDTKYLVNFPQELPLGLYLKITEFDRQNHFTYMNVHNQLISQSYE